MFKRLLANKEKPFFPDYDKRDMLSVNLCSASFYMELPANCSVLEGENNGPSVNIYNSEIYSNNKNHKEYQKGLFKDTIVFQRRWSIWGSIKEWDEQLADLTCTVLVKKVEGMNVISSCFHPSHFETILLRDLYYQFGPGNGESEKISPLNWQVKKINGSEWVYCESWSSKKYENRPQTQTNFFADFFAPIDDDYFLDVKFRGIGYLPKETSDRNLLRYVNELSATMKLQLLESALERKQVRIQESEGAKISPHRDPEPWKYHTFESGDQLLGEPARYIVKLGSEPPDIMKK